jgi:uncharacterized protein (TIGR03435 family)
MQCNEIRDQFTDFVTEDLKDSEQEEFGRHLRECSTCRKELDAFTELWVKLGAVPPGEPASTDLEIRLHHVLEEYEHEVQNTPGAGAVSKRRSRFVPNAAMPGRRSRWLAAVGISAAIAFAVLVPIGILQRAPAILEDEGRTRKIQFGEAVSPTGNSSATLQMRDGTRAEVRSKSEFQLERVDDGVRVRLTRGSIIVNAAKQPAGRHLYVQTKDVMVSVVGTVFLVNAEEEGSRVGVIEGEVRVQDAASEKKLRPGDQVTTNPAMESLPLKDEIGWSRQAEAHVASLQRGMTTLLQENRAVRQIGEVPTQDQRVSRGPTEDAEAFELISIRPSSPPEFAGRGGTLGPCGPSPKIDPSRLIALNTTVYDLTARAYRLGSCQSVDKFDLLSGGPGWLKSERFDIEALLPAGYFTGTPGFGDPKLQVMLQDLLAKRFTLVLHREIQERPVYLLTIAKGGPKLTPFKEGDERGSRSWLPPPDSKGETVWHLEAKGYALAGFGRMLPDMDRLVVDRTGITGFFNFNLEFAPRNDAYFFQPDTPTSVRSSGPTLSKAIEEQLGLKLEAARAPVEVLVIDHAEKPPKN